MPHSTMSSPWKKQPEDVADCVLKRAEVSKVSRGRNPAIRPAATPQQQHLAIWLCFASKTFKMNKKLIWNLETDCSTITKPPRPCAVQDQAWLGRPNARYPRTQNGGGDSPKATLRRRCPFRLFIQCLRSSIPLENFDELPSQGTSLF